jgi:hypothetical protein
VSSYTAAPLVPPRPPENSCTQQQLSDFYDACVSLTGTMTKCTLLRQANVVCSQCLVSAATDPTWGPIVSTPSWDFDIAGCVALVTGDASSTGCASAIAAARGCEDAACTTCEWTPGHDPSEREQCIQEADVGACAKYANAECDLSSDPTAVCRVSRTSSASFVAFASVFCSP